MIELAPSSSAALPTKRRFGIGELSVEVSAHTAPAALEWLEYFLGPWLGRTSAVAGIASELRSIELVIDPSELEQLRHEVAAGGQGEARCFLLDARVVAFRAVTAVDAQTLIHDTDADVAYVVGADGVRLVAAADGPAARVALLRVVRETISLHATRAGGVLAHAAVAAFDRGGLAIVGAKRAGKTTVLLSLLTGAGARLVANDRALISARGTSVAAHGIPTILAIRGDTIERFPSIATRLRSIPDRHWLSADEASLRRSRPWLAEGKPVDLAPASLCRALGVAPQPATELRAVVAPHIAPDASSAAARRMSPREIGARLEGVRVGADLPDRRADALWPATDGVLDEHAMSAIATLPWFELALPAGSLNAPELPAEILELVA